MRRRTMGALFLAAVSPLDAATAQIDASPDALLPSGDLLFGWRARFHRGQLLVTSPYEVQDGRLLVYERIGGAWTLVQNESAPDPLQPFGALLEVAPKTLAVGAPSGPIHVFGQDSDGRWVYEDSPVPAADPLAYGASVGAGFLVTSHGNAALEAHIETFERRASGWTAVDTFVWGSDPDVVEVRVAGDRLLTRGGRMADRTTVRTYVRAGQGWHVEAEIAHPDRPSFGPGLSALLGSTLVVQDRQVDIGTSRYFVYRYAQPGGWALEAELLPDPGEFFPQPSFDLQLSRDRVLLDDSGSDVAVFDRAGGAWTKTATLLPPYGVFVLPTAFASNGETSVVGYGVNFLGGLASIYEGVASGR